MEKPFSAYQGDEPYVFVCYAHGDKSFVYPEITRLKDAGFNIWYDEGISAGAEWTQALADAIEGSARLLFFVSPRSVQSEHCRAEVNFARSKAVPICVVHLEETTLPGSLELSLSHRQALLRHQLPKTVYEDKLLAALRGADDGAAVRAPRRQSQPSRRLWLGLGVVVVAGAAAVFAGWQTRSTEKGFPATAVAILPFEDLSPSGDQHWLASGVAEALAVYLSRIEDLRVAQAPPALAESLGYAELGQRLRVGSLVRGSVRRDVDALHVTAHLIQAADGTQLWTGRYERVLDDVFDVQREISRAIIAAIEAELDVQLPPYVVIGYNEARYGAEDVRAYELWRKSLEVKFRNNNRPTEEDVREALKYNLESVAIDPDFAMGHVGLGTAYMMLARFTNDPGDREAGKRALDRALELDPTSVVAVGNRMPIAGEDHDWAKVADLVEGLDPWWGVTDVGRALMSYVIALINLGRWDRAQAVLDEMTQLFERDPERFPPQQFVHGELAWSKVLVRRDYGTAIAMLERSLAAGAPWRRAAAPILAIAYRATGREREAVEMHVAGFDPDDPRGLTETEQASARAAYESSGWHDMLGSVADSRRRRGDDCEHAGPAVYAELGDLERMYQCLNTPADRRLADLLWTLPQYDAVRDDPRFVAQLERRNIVGQKTCCPFP